MPITKLQLYLKNCDQAIELYQKAFDATVDAIYRDDKDLIAHAEISIFGQCVPMRLNFHLYKPKATLLKY